MKLFKPMILLLVFMLTANVSYAQKELFIKQIEFELQVLSDIDYENEYFLTLKLNKGSKYIFTITNNINDKEGDAIFELLEADNLVLTNSMGDKYFNKVSFECNMTGFYDVLVRFKENKLGYCRVDVTMLQ